jgi:hypothetical protein
MLWKNMNMSLVWRGVVEKGAAHYVRQTVLHLLFDNFSGLVQA